MRLIDADRVYDLIKSRLDCNAGEKFDMAINMALRIVKKAATIDAAPVVHGRWISVTERLPKYGEGALVIVSGRPCENNMLVDAFELASYYGEEGWILEMWPEWEGATVTHWMPLPEQPVETILEKEDNSW